MITWVKNLSTDEEVCFSLPPDEAVVAAYAHGRGDRNTWLFKERYAAKVEQGQKTVICGDWCAMKKEA